MSNDDRKPLWSESEDSDNDDESKQKKKRSKTNDVESTAGDGDSKKEGDFNSKWDHFPTVDEFKQLYGEVVWGQMQDMYNELSKERKDIEEELGGASENGGKRLTCWDKIKTSTDPNAVTQDSDYTDSSKRKPGRPAGSGSGAKSSNDSNNDPPREKRTYRPRAQRTDAKYKGNRCLQCPHCDKKFDSKTQARPHLEVHTGIKPYKCSQCDYTSYSKHNVTDAHFSKRHERKGTPDDVITNQEEKERLKSLVLKESEEMVERQEKLERGEPIEENKDEAEPVQEEEGESYTSPYFQSKFNDIANQPEETTETNKVDKTETTNETNNDDKTENTATPDTPNDNTGTTEKTETLSDSNNNVISSV